MVLLYSSRNTRRAKDGLLLVTLGKVRSVFKLTRYLLLLVLSAAPLAHAALVSNGDGTVTDSATALMWDQCTYGRSGADCAGGVAFAGSWADAMVQASSANMSVYKGYSDWRVPNKKELDSIVKRDVYDPAIDTAVFPNSSSASYWTASTLVPLPTYAWAVAFYDGNIYGDDKRLSYPIRLVRGGQTWASYDSLAVIDGNCGSAQSTNLITSVPSANLCSGGSTAGSVTSGAAAYTWSCAGNNGGSTASCSASRGYTVTPSAGSGGSISPSIPQVVAYNTNTTFTATATSGYIVAGVSGCGGGLTGSTYVTGGATENCTVQATYALNTSYSGNSPSGSGSVATGLNGGGPACGFAAVGYQTAASVAPLPAGLSFPHGVLTFSTNTCDVGGTITVTLTYPQALPANVKFYKYGPPETGRPSQWYEHPATIVGNTVTYQVTDGGAGDRSDVAGVIADPAGIAIPSSATSVPVLSQWSVALLIGLMGVVVATRRGVKRRT